MIHRKYADLFAFTIEKIAVNYEPEKFKMPTRQQWTELVEWAQIYISLRGKRRAHRRPRRKAP